MTLEDIWNDLSHDERIYLGNDGWLYLGPADAPRSAAVWWDDRGYHIADYETVALPDDAEWWITTHDLVACQPRSFSEGWEVVDWLVEYVEGE